MRQKKNYFWMILMVGLLISLGFMSNSARAERAELPRGEISSAAGFDYELVTVPMSNDGGEMSPKLLANITAPAATGCTLDTTGAISYWPLNETSGTNFSDTVGTNNGSCSGSACPTPVTGASGNGQFFINSEADIINVPSTTDFDWTDEVDFSIGLWVKTTQDCDGNKVFIGRYRNNPVNGTWWMGCVPEAGDTGVGFAAFHMRDSDNVPRTATSSSAINDGEWHYIVGVRDGTADENKIYVDGTLETTVTTPGYTGTFASDDVITFGGYDEPTDYYLAGTLDEVAVFSTVLGATEINSYLGTCTPEVENPGDQTSDEGEVISLQIVATDPQGQDMTYEATGLPPDLTIDEPTGLISGTIAYTTSPDSPYAVTVTVTDTDTNETSVDFNWTVNRVNLPPEVTNPGDQSDVEGDVISLQIVATDPNDDPLTYGATNLPTGLNINTSTGEISGTIAYTASPDSPYDVTVTVTDIGAYETSVDFTWTVTRVNIPPWVTNPGDQSNLEGDSVSLQIVATDDNEDPLTYGASNLPSGLSIGMNTGLIEGEINAGASDFSPYNVTVSVDDGEAAPVEVNFEWTVARDNAPPDVTNPGDQTNTEGDDVSLQIEATDPDGDSLEYSALGLPPGLSINSSTGLISGVIDSNVSDFSPYNVTVSVDDGIADLVQVMFNWTIESPINYIHLPLISGDPCTDFFDDFSDPASGWAIGEEDYYRYEYLDGEYRILSKDDRFDYLFAAPTCPSENYTVEVDARWVGTPGESYGILFGIIGFYDQFYVFDVNTDYQEYRLLRFDGDEYHSIVPITSSPYINSGTASNHLKITRNGYQITIEVNGNTLGSWTDSSITGETYTGITSTPYTGYPTSDARFDNFSVSLLNSMGQSLVIRNSSLVTDTLPRTYKIAPHQRYSPIIPRD